MGGLALALAACSEEHKCDSGDASQPSCSSPSSAGSAATGGSSSGGSNAGGGSDPLGTAAAPTWHAEVAPIVALHCQGCHQEGGIAPFSLQSYEQAKMWSKALPGVVAVGQMPPFLAAETDDCKPRFAFKDDLRLSADKLAVLDAWAAAGAPEGDPLTAAPLPTPPALELDDADVTVTIPSPITVEGGSDQFICFSLAPDLAPLAPTGPEAAVLGERVLVDAVQVHPGNAAIVHHVLVYTDAEGESAALAGDQGYYDCFGGPGLSAPSLVMAWAPGSTPIQAPEGVALAIPSTGRLVMQVHYHPVGAPQTDSATSLQLRKYDAGIPDYIASMTLMGNSRGTSASGMGLQPGPNDGAEAEFKIPAGAQNHTETMRLTVPADGPPNYIWAVGTHMHYVGTDMRIGITRANPGSEPADECLLQTPNWDFNWQRGYLYDVPIAQAPTARGGDTINLRCTYDNSMQNPFVAQALQQQGLAEPRDVLLGEATLDEMCLGVFGIAQKVSDLLQ